MMTEKEYVEHVRKKDIVVDVGALHELIIDYRFFFDHDNPCWDCPCCGECEITLNHATPYAEDCAHEIFKNLLTTNLAFGIM